MDKNEGALYENRVRENAIVFTKEGGEWVMRITQDCISVNDNVSVDDAAQAVVAAIGRYLNKSKWVGMTDEEVSKYFEERWTGYSGYFSCFEEVMKWAEEKLRSRNGG